MKTFRDLMLLTTSLTALAGAAWAGQPAPPAGISLDEARTIALTVASGAVADQEYEEENGAWRYSFEFKQDGRIHEIGVDANSGVIVEDSWEDASDHD